MNEQLRDQISAFLDSELPGEEQDLLLRRLNREDDAHALARRYLVIGQALRAERLGGLADRLHERVMHTLDGLDARSSVGPSWSPSAALIDAPPVPAAAATQKRGRANVWSWLGADLRAVAAVAIGAMLLLRFVTEGPVPGSPELAQTVETFSAAAPTSLSMQTIGNADTPNVDYALLHSDYAFSLGRLSILTGTGIEPVETSIGLQPAGDSGSGSPSGQP